MATLHKRSENEGAPWYIRYRQIQPDGTAKQRMISAKTSDKATARQIATKLESENAARAHGLIDPQLEAYAKTRKTPVADFLPAFEAKIRTKGKGETKNAKQQLGYLRKFAAHQNIEVVGGIAVDRVNAYKVYLMDLGRSSRTVQANINTFKHFTSWLVKSGRLPTDPLASVAAPNPDKDRRELRRMLLPDEWQWLAHGTLAAGKHGGMEANARLLLYRTCIQTGLRSNEIASLSRAHFDLPRLVVRVPSNDTKNALKATQNIDQGLASDLTEYLSTRPAKQPAFAMPSASRVVDMIRRDLARARKIWIEQGTTEQEQEQRELSDFLAVENEAGERFDFHSLRHTCGAWLALEGVQPKVIQSVMRHSTITLTLDTYGHMLKGSEAAAVTQNAKFTDVPNEICSLFAHILAAKPCQTVLNGANMESETSELEKRKNPLIPKEKAGFQGVLTERRARESNPQLLPATDFESISKSQNPLVLSQFLTLAHLLLTQPDLGGVCLALDTDRLLTMENVCARLLAEVQSVREGRQPKQS